jgi:hypothetical protein
MPRLITIVNLWARISTTAFPNLQHFKRRCVSELVDTEQVIVVHIETVLLRRATKFGRRVHKIARGIDVFEDVIFRI